MKLIVGLGNPGPEYAGTRHNVGFEVIDLLAKRHRILTAKRDFKSVLGDGQIGGERVLLVRPMTYMNLSGEALAAIAQYYHVGCEDILVILDDVALPPGKIRLRFKGSAGGHNGMANIIKLLHTQEIPRIRIGVGAPPPGNLIGHVLARFRKEELPLMREAYERAADAVECALSAGFDIAMNRFNISDKPAPETPPNVPKAGDKKQPDSA
ncbi:MAG TPA: aminoacyl-tRNA hydrolase [Chthonomonadaceae bacterium]|nr:aminoacyl-tRNA hydrolase [Chthonomonadaceae bacterium]